MSFVEKKKMSVFYVDLRLDVGARLVVTATNYKAAAYRKKGGNSLLY